MQIKHLDIFSDNPTNPARVDFGSGVIEVNDFAFYRLPAYCQEFVILHEIGHYKLQTASETKADDYALKCLAFKKKHSLKNHINSVYSLAKDDPRRKDHALMSALRYAAKDGNREAEQLLKEYEGK